MTIMLAISAVMNKGIIHRGPSVHFYSDKKNHSNLIGDHYDHDREDKFTEPTMHTKRVRLRYLEDELNKWLTSMLRKSLFATKYF